MTDTIVPFSQRLDELEARVRAASDLRPRLGMVLGSGLGGLADEIERCASRSPSRRCRAGRRPRVPGHSGRLHPGHAAGSPGGLPAWPPAHVRGARASDWWWSRPCSWAASVRRSLLLTNASGGVNPAFGAGTLMVMRDHINLTGRNPLMGAQRRQPRPALPGHERGLGPRAARAPPCRRPGRGRGAARGCLPGADRTDLRDARGGAHDPRPRCRCGGHVHGHGGHRRQLGRAARVWGVAGDQRRGRAVADAADPRRGGRGCRRGRATPGASHRPLR